MPRDFKSLGEFAFFLGELVVAEREACHHGLERSARLVEKTAKEKLGHEQGNWPPLAQSTLDDKESKGYPTPSPLLRDGEMQGSIEHHVADLEAEVGSNSQIAVWQELGTSKMPARSFLASSAIEKEREVVEIIGEDVMLVMGGEAKSGGRWFMQASGAGSTKGELP
jgi:phage gpG-like protein